ncbi:expressed protein [Chlorella variabilis]|uniref:Expressed protein n=1 Tax=Chlorella variabilis TaxID=554065 RepID=E1Z8N5_CHLVA|nr:expressed protein [Chlorella variabilis]EFN57639.1 expressed protein [Chlorella variabilis]|eukprot:XP_005849741.1 expressed protein [Chlorella variabilis]
MTSKAEALFTFKSFGSNGLPSEAPVVGISTVLKKRQGDATLSLQLNDSTLRDPKSLKGVVLAAEKPLGAGVKGTIAYNAGAKDTIATVTIDKKLNGNDLSLKGSYQFAGDVFILQETWKFNKQNKLVGTYNFAKEEAVFSLEHTRGSLKLGALYSLKTEKPVVSIEKKRGKDTFSAAYGIKDEATTLSWQHKPFKTIVRGKAGKGGVKGVTAAVLITHEFEL